LQNQFSPTAKTFWLVTNGWLKLSPRRWAAVNPTAVAELWSGERVLALGSDGASTCCCRPRACPAERLIKYWCGAW